MTVVPLAPSPRPLTIAAISVAWFAAALGAGALGMFQTAPGSPPIAIGLAAGVPPLTVVALAIASERFRLWARSLDLRFLTLMQTSRLGGLAFLALAAVHALPNGFAIPAGLGDVAVGLTAPLVAAFVVGRSDRLFIAWTVLGIADLVNAVSLGVLYSPTPIGLLQTEVSTALMATLPMSLIPAFGVPFTLVLHVISLVNLTGRRRPGRRDQ